MAEEAEQKVERAHEQVVDAEDTLKGAEESLKQAKQGGSGFRAKAAIRTAEAALSERKENAKTARAVTRVAPTALLGKRAQPEALVASSMLRRPATLESRKRRRVGARPAGPQELNIGD